MPPIAAQDRKGLPEQQVRSSATASTHVLGKYAGLGSTGWLPRAWGNSPASSVRPVQRLRTSRERDPGSCAEIRGAVPGAQQHIHRHESFPLARRPPSTNLLQLVTGLQVLYQHTGC